MAQDNAKGIALMVLAMGAFAIADTLIKVSANAISPSQVMLILTAGSLAFFIVLAKIQGETLRDARAFTPVLLVRYAAEVIGFGAMVMALATVPLSTVGAILQASPLIVTLGAVLFLGERVSWRRWTAIIVGFLGVLMIVQPGADGFETTVLWALLATTGLSIRDLVTRLTPPGLASSSLAAYTMAAAMPFALAWVTLTGQPFVPPDANWLFVVGMVGFGSIGYLILTLAIRMAEVSVVAPFRYSRLPFMLILGFLVFGERPSAEMLFGAALIIGSGIYIMWRERQVKAETVNG
ncbi:MAG: DMT family transporter [Pseudomonadota bacterium]